MSKPHIRLHCRRQFDEIVWRAQIGPHPLGSDWFPSAYRAIRDLRVRQALLEDIDRLVDPPMLNARASKAGDLRYDPRDFMSVKPYIPKQ